MSLSLTMTFSELKTSGFEPKVFNTQLLHLYLSKYQLHENVS